MKSRYNKMKAGSVKDIDGELFPDPLSINYSKVQLTVIPTETMIVTTADLDCPWLAFYKKYNETGFDDLLWNMLGIPFFTTLEPGDELPLLDMRDIEACGSVENLKRR